MAKKKLYWFSICFTHIETKSDGAYTKAPSLTVGYPDKLVSPLRVEEARDTARMPKGSVLANVSYLGKATQEKFSNHV